MFELRIREIISRTLDIPIEELMDEADIVDDLGADSIEVLDLIFAIEKEFNIKITDEEVVKNRSVRNVIDFVLEKM